MVDILLRLLIAVSLLRRSAILRLGSAILLWGDAVLRLGLALPDGLSIHRLGLSNNHPRSRLHRRNSLIGGLTFATLVVAAAPHAATDEGKCKANIQKDSP